MDNNKRARCTIMIKKGIDHERLKKYEDNTNSSVAIRIKDGDSRWIYVLGIYRQWKLAGDVSATSTEGIKKTGPAPKITMQTIH